MGRNPILSGRTYGESLKRAEQATVERRPEGPSDPAPPPEPEPELLESDPPPPRKRQDSALDRTETHARWWKSVATIVGSAVAIFGVVIPAVVWAIGNWVVKPQVDALRNQLDPLVLRPSVDDLQRLALEKKLPPPTLDDRFAELHADNVKTRETIDATSPFNPGSVFGKKLDALDSTLRVRLPARPDKPSVPPVGPTATREGRQ